MFSEGFDSECGMLADGEWRRASGAEDFLCAPHDAQCTVFLQNLPGRCTAEEVICTLTELGWGSDISSVSLPMRPSKAPRARHNCGYGFLHCNSPLAARSFLSAMADGFRISTRSSCKVVLVAPTQSSAMQSGPLTAISCIDSCSSLVAMQIPSKIVPDVISQWRNASPFTVQRLQL